MDGEEEESLEEPDDTTPDSDDPSPDGSEDEPEPEEIDVSADEEVELKKPLEAQVDMVLGDFEMDALKSAKVNEQLSFRFILNEETDSFDVQHFANNVARLIDNYTTLLDIESAIYYRATAMLEKNYGIDVVDAFRQIMHSRHDFDFGDVRLDPIEGSAPLALGSGGGEAAS
ncbi:MAG: hypothetical protein H8E12_25005 [Rhodobacteraceae bacterium]|nr:hypothetical protein [Paracoccaceae bacterium]